jgi:DNA helicase-2/ATP-dependent DNA helicase PcrA
MSTPTRAQQEMIETVQQPNCVVAIPGSGKTSTVIQKIGHLLTGHENGLWPYQKHILALSYTKEAAEALDRKVKDEIGDRAIGLLATGTFHSYFLRALRRVGATAVCGKDLVFEGVVKQTMAIAVRRVYGDDRDGNRDIIKRMLRFRELGGAGNQDAIEPENFARVLREFEAIMKEDRKFDFVSIINTAVQFLNSQGSDVERTNNYRAEAVRKNYTWPDELQMFVNAGHVIVDEAQDLDRSQMDIILKLAENGMVVDIVGDDDQSIYRFRGGLGYWGMKEFMEKTGAVEIKFERNFRSRAEILQLAQVIIDENIHRIPKTLNPFHGRGDDVISLDKWEYAETEVSFIINNIAERLSPKGRGKPDESIDMAILARKNSQLDHFELALKARGIAHYRAPKESIWLKMPLAAILAFLKDPMSTETKSGTRQILEWADINSDNIDFASLETFVSQDTRGKALARELVKVRDDIRYLGARATDEDVSNVIGSLYKWVVLAIKLNGEEKCWTKKRQEANRNFAMWGARTLGGTTAIQSVEREEPDKSECDLDEVHYDGFKGSLSSRISALEYLGKACEEERQAIKLLTMHGGKGLEFGEVWLVGCDDDTIPGKESKECGLSEWERVEEERRILYVAVTRAKWLLHISYSEFHHFSHKYAKRRSLSRFLNVIHRNRIPTRELYLPPKDYSHRMKV